MTRKILFGGLVVLASLVSFLAGVSATLHSIGAQTQHRIEHVREQWRQTLDREVPVGATRADAASWMDLRIPRTKVPLEFKLNAPNPFGSASSYDPEHRRFSAMVASIDTPTSFACADTLVLVEIGMGADDRVAYRKVLTRPGVCL